MNDRQRTVIGFVAVFSLVGIAVLSLALMSRTPGGITIQASEEAAISQDNILNDTSDSLEVSLTGNIVTVKALEQLPQATLKITMSGVDSPSAQNNPAKFTKSGSLYNAEVGVGAMKKDEIITLPIQYTPRTNFVPYIQVAASADGFSYPVLVSAKLQ